MKRNQEAFIAAVDGLRLFRRLWLPEGQPAGTVALVHGFAEHSGRYGHLADLLCSMNFSFATFDLRGHGQSDGKRAHVDRFEDYLLDIDSFLEQLPEHLPQPVWLLGHSLGGLIATRYVQSRNNRVAGLILSSPFLGFAIKVPGYKAIAGRLLSGVIPALTMKTGLDPAVLSHDEEVVRKYRDDPLVNRVASARWFTETTEAQRKALEDAPSLSMPLLVLQAGDDKLSSVEVTRLLFERAGSEDKDIEIYPGMYHEVFNETERQKPMSRLAEWLEKHAG